MTEDCLEKHNDIIDVITNSTNNQTSIITVDLMSNNKYIIELEKVFYNSRTIKSIRKRDGHTINNNEIRLANSLKLWHCIHDPIKENSKESVVVDVFNHLTDKNKSVYINDIDIFYKDVLFCSVLYSKIIKNKLQNL